MTPHHIAICLGFGALVLSACTARGHTHGYSSAGLATHPVGLSLAEPSVADQAVTHASYEPPDDAIEHGSQYQCDRPRGRLTVSLKPEIQLHDLVVWAMSFSCKTIVYRSDLASLPLTVLAPNKMSPAQAWTLFVLTVETMGLELKDTGDIVTITGRPDARHLFL